MKRYVEFRTVEPLGPDAQTNASVVAELIRGALSRGGVRVGSVSDSHEDGWILPLDNGIFLLIGYDNEDAASQAHWISIAAGSRLRDKLSSTSKPAQFEALAALIDHFLTTDPRFTDVEWQ